MKKFTILKNPRLLISIIYLLLLVYKLGAFKISSKYDGWGQLDMAFEMYYLSIGTVIISINWMIYFLLQKKKLYALMCALIILVCLILRFDLAAPIVIIITFAIECIVSAFIFGIFQVKK